MVQEIVLSDPIIVQHDGKPVPVTELIQSIGDCGRSSTGLHGRYIKVRSG
jgi:hypothetical protein